MKATRAWMISLGWALAVAGCGDPAATDRDGGDRPMMDAAPDALDAGPAATLDGGPADFDAGGDDADGGVTTDRDGGDPSDDAGPEDGIACGTERCDPRTEQCCRQTSGGTRTQTCIGADELCDGITSGCDGPEDCAASEVCCIAFASPGTGGGATCTAMDACSGRRACHVSSDCPTGQVCCDGSSVGRPSGVCSERC